MKSQLLTLIALLLLLTNSLYAQEDIRYSIQLKSGSVIPEKNISAEKLNEFNQRSLRVEQKAFAVIQFQDILTEVEKLELKQSGIELLEYIPNYAYTVTISGGLDNAVLEQTGARAFLEIGRASCRERV